MYVFELSSDFCRRFLLNKLTEIPTYLRALKCLKWSINLFERLLQGGAITFSPPLLHNYKVEGLKILLSHPVQRWYFQHFAELTKPWFPEVLTLHLRKKARILREDIQKYSRIPSVSICSNILGGIHKLSWQEGFSQMSTKLKSVF